MSATAAAVSGAARLQASSSRRGANAAINLGGYGLTVVIAFLIWPLQIHRLGPGAYGVWAILQQLIGYTLLLDFGVRIAVMRSVAQLYTLDDRQGLDQAISTAVTLMLAPAALVLVTAVVTAHWLPELIHLPLRLYRPAALAAILTGFTMATTIPAALFSGAMAGLSRYDLLALRNAAVQLGRALLLWYFLLHGAGLIAVATIVFATEGAGQLLTIALTFRLLRPLHFRFRIEPAIARELLQFGFYAFLMSIALRLVYWSDNVVVGVFAGAAAVAFYSVAGSLVQYLRDLIVRVVAMLGPITAQMDAIGDRDGLRQIYLVGTRLGSALMMPGVMLLVLAGPAFIRLWIGPAFAAESAGTLRVLTLSALAVPLAAMYGHVLYATNRHRINGWLSLLEAGLNLVLSLWLVRRCGAIGAAWGTLIPAALIQMIVLPAYTLRQLRLSPAHYYWQGWLRSGLSVLPAAAGLEALVHAHWAGSWLTLIASSLLFMIGAGVGLWCFSLTAAERSWVRSRLLGRRRLVEPLAIAPM